jgi:hypothetical protein
MSTQPAFPLPSFASVGHAPQKTDRELSIAGFTLTGMMLFVTSLLVVGSGFVGLRPVVFGLALHPYLVPVALAFPFVVMARIHEFPMRVLAAFAVFYGMYFFSVFNGQSLALGELFKSASGLVTMVVCALLVRRRGDFVAGALGLMLAVTIFAGRGLQDDTRFGVQAIEGANKNSYSMFALPALLLGGFVVLNFPSAPKIVKGLIIVCSLPVLVAIFMSANRSGYLGAVIVGGMLFWDRRGKGMLLVAGIVAAVAFLLIRFGSTAALDTRLKQTAVGNESDHYRVAILLACLEIGLENPILGVSPSSITVEIGRRTSVKFRNGYIDSHNVFAHIFAGSGLICFAALLGVGWVLWNWKPRGGIPLGGQEDPLRSARHLLRMMIFLWIVRGMFTREILYNPSFNIAMGLVIGLCMLAEVAREELANSDADAIRGVPPTIA